MLRHTLAAASIAVLILSPALGQSTQSKSPAGAQEPAPAQSTAQQQSAQQPATPQFLQQQSSNDWRSSNLVGASVTGRDNQSIGEIEDVLIEKNGAVKAVVLGVGGFLGMGGKDVAIPFNALTIQRKADGKDIDKVSVSLTKEQLQQAPAFKYLADANKATSSDARQTTGADKR
jgi:sporulation protein YlmC with PRC-barrel domain